MEIKTIRVRVFPGSKKGEVIEKSEDSFDIKVKKKPQQGRANQAVIGVLADYFKISKQKIRLIRGFKKRNKTFEIEVIK